MTSLCRELFAALVLAALVVLFGGVLLRLDPGFFWNDDNQLYHVAAYLEAARAWHEGELPLLSRANWQGGALAAEFLNGVFSLFLYACGHAMIEFAATGPEAAAFLTIVHLVVLVLGAYALARQRGLSIDLAYLVAVVTGVNGYLIIWGAMLWLPTLVSFAWLPWTWWALERGLRKPTLGRTFVAGAFLYLLISAGWPFTVLMIALVSAWLGTRGWSTDDDGTVLARVAPVQAFGVLGGAWLIGLGLSAPAWLMLLEYTPHTMRGQLPLWRPAYGLEIPPGALPALIFPPFITTWNLFEGHKPHLGAELAGGLVPIVILLAAWARNGSSVFRRVRGELLLVGLVLLLALLPSLGSFRWSFRWLPLFFLLLGLIAAHVLDAQRRTVAGASNLGIWALALVAPCGLAVLALGRDPTPFTREYGLILCGLCSLWLAAEQVAWPTLARFVPALVVLAANGFLFAQIRPFLEAQTWTAGNIAPELDPARRYLSVHTWEDIVAADDRTAVGSRRGLHAHLMPGNFASYAGLRFVSGYSPHQPLGLTDRFGFEIHGTVPQSLGERVLRDDSGPTGLLALLGVDGLIVAERFAHLEPILETNGWRRVASVPGGRMYHQTATSPAPAFCAAPPMRWTNELRVADAVRSQGVGVAGAESAKPRFAGVRGVEDSAPATQAILPFHFDGCCVPAKLSDVHESRNAVTLNVQNSDSQETLVVFRRPWFPGYRARLGDQTLRVETVSVLPAVRVPPGAEGRLVLEYRPASLIVGLRVVVCTSTAVVMLILSRWFFRVWFHPSQISMP